MADFVAGFVTSVVVFLLLIRKLQEIFLFLVVFHPISVLLQCCLIFLKYYAFLRAAFVVFADYEIKLQHM